MKIAHILDSLKIGGAQKLQITFVQAAYSRGIDVCVISLTENAESPLPRQLRELGAEVIELPAKRVLDTSRLRALAGLLREKDVDVIQTHLTTANVVGAIAGAATGIPVVATLHSAGVDKRLVPLHRRVMESLLLRVAASAVVAVGHVVAETNRKRLGRKQIHVIPNAVAPFPLFTVEERHRVREEIVGDSRRPLFISVGRLSMPKGYPDLLNAFHIVRQKHASAALVIVGEGMMQKQLEEQIQKLDLQRHAFLLGFRDDVPRLLSAADVYVSSSHWEGLPVSVLEAMSAGLPVIATAVGDLTQVLTGSVGILVPPLKPERLAEEMIGLLQNCDRRRRMGEDARMETLRHYSPDAWMSRWVRLYSKVAPKVQVELPV